MLTLDLYFAKLTFSFKKLVPYNDTSNYKYNPKNLYKYLNTFKYSENIFNQNRYQRIKSILLIG